MRKIARVFLIGTFIAIVWRENVLAAPLEADTGISVQAVFGITIIIAIVVALFLFHFAKKEGAKDIASKRSGPLKWNTDKEPLTSTISSEITKQISEQIGNLSGSVHDRERVAGTIVNIVNDELKKKTRAVKTELSQKYEEIVEEKKQRGRKRL